MRVVRPSGAGTESTALGGVLVVVVVAAVVVLEAED
jgi:hypothetical protein